MISIDNSVELMMQTYIQLPKRVTGVDLSRKAREEICAGFPNLLDGIEKHASGKLAGINLGEIEWFHRLRNQLYHQGNGLTVERQKVEIYAEMAATFFGALFDLDLPISQTKRMENLGEYLNNWGKIEAAINRASKGSRFSSGRAIIQFVRDGMLAERNAVELEELRQIRNQVVHSKDGIDLIDKKLLDQSKRVAKFMETNFPEEGQ